MGNLLNVSICLTDIPKEQITEGKNGKKYCNIVIAERQNTDNYGNTHTVYMSQSKEQREAKAEKKYIGNAKLKFFEESNQQRATDQALRDSGNVNPSVPMPYDDQMPF